MNAKRRNSGWKAVLFVCAAVMAAGCLNGCGYVEGVVQKSEKSFLWFTGNTENAVVYIDDKEFVRLTASYYIDEKTGEKTRKEETVHYQIEPGKHEIRVERDGKVLVNRLLILGNQMTKEIDIP